MRRRAGCGSERAASNPLCLLRLAQVFREAPADDITRAVEGRHHAFDGRPIRDFVPVLVERTVKQQIQAGGSRHRA
jgi:hypothetical protein